MTFEEFKKRLEQGYKITHLAEAFNCSISNINKLKRLPVDGEVYVKGSTNYQAFYDYAIKHQIDLDALDYAKIVRSNRSVKSFIKLEIGVVTEFGIVVGVNKVGSSYTYVIKTPDNYFIVKRSKELKESVNE